jgi:small subunit ribosomal protein S17
MTEVRLSRRTVVGIVIGTKMNKTIVVRVESLYKHAKYGKYLRHRKKYYAHDEDEKAGIGDMVEIESCRPLSKLKRWRLAEIVQAAPDRGAEVAAVAAAGAEDVLASKKQKKLAEEKAAGGAA